MNAQTKNVVVAGLVVVALGYHAWNLFGKKRARPTPPPPAAVAAAAATASPAAALGGAAPAPSGTGAATVASAKPTPQLPIDDALIRANLKRWFESPRRDPFEARLPIRVVKDDRPPASALLRLQALWRQTGGHLAVVNDHVHAVGDVIAGFEIERIEDALIWVRGSQGRERVDLRAPNLNPVAIPTGDFAVKTNRAPRSTTQRSPAGSRPSRPYAP